MRAEDMLNKKNRSDSDKLVVRAACVHTSPQPLGGNRL